MAMGAPCTAQRFDGGRRATTHPPEAGGALLALGIEPAKLQALQKQGTPVLPGLGI